MLSELGNTTIDLFKNDNGRIWTQAHFNLIIIVYSCDDHDDSTGMVWNVVILCDGL